MAKYKVNFYKYGDWTVNDLKKGRKHAGVKKNKMVIRNFEINDNEKLEDIRKKVLKELGLPNSNTCRWQLTSRPKVDLWSERSNETFEQFKEKTSDPTTLNLYEGPGETGRTGTGVWIAQRRNEDTHKCENRSKIQIGKRTK